MSISIFLVSSSAVMVGYVLVRDIKHKMSQAESVAGQSEEIQGVNQPSEEIVSEYQHLVKKTA